MPKSALDKDDYGEPIQGALTPQTAKSVSITTSTARNSSDFAYRVIRVITTVNCFIKLGDSTVEAAVTDHYLPAGAIEYFARKENTRIAGITSSGSGTIYISEMR